MHACFGEGVRPRELARGESDPGGRIHLDHVGGGTTRVTRTFNTLHGTEGRHTHFDGVAGVCIGEHLQEVAHGRGELWPRYADFVGYSTSGDFVAHGNDGRTTVIEADARRCHVSSLPGEGEFGHTP